MSTLYLVLSLVAIFFHQTESTCVSDQHINGCSVPIRGNFPYETRFKSACDRHDVCYRCGIVYQWSRTSCDNAFLKDMLAICYKRYDGGSGLVNKVKIKVCNGAAKAYYKAVHWFGANRYRQVILPWCAADQCVKENGKPNLRK